MSTGSVEVHGGEDAQVAVLGQGLASLGGHDGPAQGRTTHKGTTEGAEMTTKPKLLVLSSALYQASTGPKICLANLAKGQKCL